MKKSGLNEREYIDIKYGTEITEAIAKAHGRARCLGRQWFRFNGLIVVVCSDSDSELLLSDYLKALRVSRDTDYDFVVGPYYPDPYYPQ